MLRNHITIVATKITVNALTVTAGILAPMIGIHDMANYEKNKLFEDKQKLTVDQIKDLLTSEVVDQNNVCNIHSKNVFHTVLVDYETGEIQIAFTGPEGVLDKPEFINIGHY